MFFAWGGSQLVRLSVCLLLTPRVGGQSVQLPL